MTLYLSSCLCDPVFSCEHLCCVLRYVGQSGWFHADKRGNFNWDFLDHKDTPLEEVNMNYTVINYTGLANLGNELQLCFFSLSFFLFSFQNNFSSTVTKVSQWYLACTVSVFDLLCPPSEGQRSLRTLSLRGCPEVDDWFLARLHVLQDSLEELDISHCPRITTGGLAALRNLK